MFRKRLMLVLVFLAILGTGMAQKPVDWVNPFIGTSNFGACLPGAIAPHGMISVVPFNVAKAEGNKQNMVDGWNSTPYVQENKFLTGFSHVNLSGVGCPDMGALLLMPTTGDVDPNYHRYGSTYHDEEAHPGYYTVTLDKYNVKAEMSATTRSGISRYTFPKGQANILLNLGHSLTNETGAYAKIISDTEIEGYKMLGTFCYNNNDAVFPVYFVVRFSKPAKAKGYWKYHNLERAAKQWSSTAGTYKLYPKYLKEMSGDKIGTYFSFDAREGEQIQVELGVSYVSIENARANLNAEQPSFDFDRVRNQTYTDWNTDLSRIKVEGGNKDDKVKFYTALYHMLIHPNIVQDINGEYPIMESNEIGTIENGDRYTVFSLWDTYRNLNPLLSLVYPEHMHDMATTLIDMYKEWGWLPKWELYGKESFTMNGDPAVPVLADAYLRGIKNIDIETAYEGMLHSATTPEEYNRIRKNSDFYCEQGYMPFLHKYDNSVSEALEYYIADWNIAQLAKAMGKKGDYKKFLNRSLGYKNYFNKEFNLFVPKKENGDFIKDFDPLMGRNFAPSHGFHEGTSWNYSFFVPHDIKGLIALHGGGVKFTGHLDECFAKGYYDATNEPNIAYPYLYNYVKGCEWKTQREVNNQRKVFTNTPGGIPGNDDTGTLSAWLVYSMMGFYPVCPGDMNYAITSPVFDKVTIELDSKYYSGKKIEIVAKHNNANDVYIKQYSWNGKKQRNFFFNHNELVKGGTLEFELSDKH